MKLPIITLNFDDWTGCGGRALLGGHMRLKRVYLPARIWALTGFGWTPLCVGAWRPFSTSKNIGEIDPTMQP